MTAVDVIVNKPALAVTPGHGAATAQVLVEHVWHIWHVWHVWHVGHDWDVGHTGRKFCNPNRLANVPNNLPVAGFESIAYRK